MGRRLSADRSGISTWGAFVLMVIALAVIIAGYYTFFVPKAPAEDLRAQEGDRVSVDYVGYFEDNGLVFDTSLLSVARDNASFPKAASFSWRPRWVPLSFTVGSGEVVQGFDQGVVGLMKGESRTLVVPPSAGYGESDPSKFVTKPIFESVPVRLTMNLTEFESRYGSPPFSGMIVTDPVWAWDAFVGVADTIVTVTNSPSIGQIVRPLDVWDAKVVRIDDAANQGDGAITVQHLLEEEMVGRIRGTSNGEDFVLTDVDFEEGTYTLNFNREVVGRTLVFEVTVVGVIRL